MPVLDSYVKSIQGNTHAFEDRVLIDEARMLYAVADGVTRSSQGTGGVAADVALKLLAERFSGEITKAVEEVHKEMTEMKQKDRTIGETTLTCAHLHGDLLEVASLGDSPAYLVRGYELRSLAHEEIDWLLTQALGHPERVQVNHTQTLLEKGDYVILASDGLSHVLKPTMVFPLAGRGLSSKGMVHGLLGEAESHPTRYDDDKTAIVLKFFGNGSSP